MAISLATTLTPFMGRGQPRVVITGRFAFGQVKTLYDGSVRYIPGWWLSVAGLAEAAQGRVFSMRFSGRPSLPKERSYTWGGQTISDYLVNGLTVVEYANLGSQYPSYADMAGLLRTANSYYMPTLSAYYETYGRGTGYIDMGLGSAPPAAPGMVDAHPELWSCIPGAYRIELVGQLAMLNLRVLAATSLAKVSDNAVPTVGLFTENEVDSDSSYMARYANYYVTDPSLLVDGTWMGWRTDSVHIIDQPWLRGHVLGANLAEQGVVWD